MIGKFDNFQKLFITRGVNTGRVTPHLPLAYPFYGRFNVLDTLIRVDGIQRFWSFPQERLNSRRVIWMTENNVDGYHQRMDKNVL